MAETIADTRRLISKPQNLNDAYGPPSNFLEIDVGNPQTVGVGRGRFTTYEIRVKTNLPIFKLKESTVRRRYSDFEWLRNELERESKVVVPPLPGKALLRQLPFRGDDGIFDDSFIEERKQALEQFINKCEVLSACVMMHIFSNHHENLYEDVETLPEGCRPPTGTERALSSHVLTR
ncbi:sorting nexin-3 isoform X1 [Haliaeetus albicilla]|uniref:sorting nexin-3 isoform X1 n=1 Tax=Haliaeetus leucocephalus TaxID=52644 RepID=UPI00053CBEA6|nr:PREDICTED: sorting nexin-3 isoform X1 [Haliaeetus leucocephalus]